METEPSLQRRRGSVYNDSIATGGMHRRTVFRGMAGWLAASGWGASGQQIQRPGNSQRPAAVARFRVTLPPHRYADQMLLESPFGINTQIFRLDDPNMDQHLAIMQQAGIKWGRQDFTWRQIETAPGRYNLDPYERIVRAYHKHGMHLFGNLAYNPKFHDPRTLEGVAAYCRFAREVVEKFRGRVNHWQLWNEPNGGFWDGTPEEYARMAAAAGRVIHEANPEAKVLALNMAFCDILWARTVLKLIPYDSFDIVCYHPYRIPSPPEEQFDWWTLDRYQKVALSPWHKGRVPEDYAPIRQSFLEQTRDLIQLLESYGPRKPLWITEVGWNALVAAYGTPELRQADLLVRLYLLALGSGFVQKIFPWAFRDSGVDQQSGSQMVGLVRSDLSPRYSYYAYGWMTRMLEGKRWIRNDEWGPRIWAVVFRDEADGEDLIAAWTTDAYAYLRVTNERGIRLYDLYGTRREIPFLGQPGSPPLVELSQWTASAPGTVTVPLSRSPIYIVGAAGMMSKARPNPGE
ncbi:MAG: hypothetical protein ACUVXB_13620 [Bryobacteraceae bacterium]